MMNFKKHRNNKIIDMKQKIKQLVTLGLILFAHQALADIPPSEREALIKLYHSTNGNGLV